MVRYEPYAMKIPRREYEIALADFTTPGNRWRILPRLVYWGKAAGMVADEIIADAHGANVHNRDADIRRCWGTAHPQYIAYDYLRNLNRRQHATRYQPQLTCPWFVRDTIGDIQMARGATADIVRNLSPSPFSTDGREQTVAFFRSLFAPMDILHVFRTDVPMTGKIDVNLMPCHDWCARIERGTAIPGDLIVPNPFTGAEGETIDGKKSYIAQSCLAKFPYVVIEFDTLSLSFQYAFWYGFLTKSRLAPYVAAITYSGGKSLHGLLHVGCDTLKEWRDIRDKLCGLLASDPEQRTNTNGRTIYPFRADIQAMRPRQGTRLPGVRRVTNGKLQELLYLNPSIVHRQYNTLPPQREPFLV